MPVSGLTTFIIIIIIIIIIINHNFLMTPCHNEAYSRVVRLGSTSDPNVNESVY